MRNLLIAITGFIVGGAVVGALAFLPQTTGGAVKQVTTKRTAMPHMTVGMRMASGTMTSASLATRELTIRHVQKGCHVWSNGKTTGAMMRLRLKPGQRLAIMDMDVDAHQMMQFLGPTHMQMGRPMMMNHGMTMSFPKSGVYRLGTKTVEMPGAMDVKTIGPDNNLRLVVTVA